MALNQTSSNLAENEQKILSAGRIPYESFKVRNFPPPSPPLSGFALAKICFPFLFLGGGEKKV